MLHVLKIYFSPGCLEFGVFLVCWSQTLNMKIIENSYIAHPRPHGPDVLLDERHEVQLTIILFNHVKHHKLSNVTKHVKKCES